ncbi:MAG TPA: sigma-70 family RNA polymerase sigma factor [Usitatibacter sp.]|nr:sigma-70 family RNA polymerase sigma factor [Usitatibacter sp.]
MLGRSAAHFDQVVRAYSPELFHFALWLARDRHRAEDILQEALARAWGSWGRVKDEGARRAWLYTIVRNEFYRNDERRRRVQEEELDEAVLAELRDERDFTRGLEIRQILDRVPAAIMEPLVLQNLGGLSCEEIASVLGVSAGAAATRISRARSAVRDLMRKAEERPAAARKEVVR